MPGRVSGSTETWGGKASFVDHNRPHNSVACNRVTVLGPSTASKILVRAWSWQRKYRAPPAKASSTVVYRIPEDAKALIRSCVRGLRGERKSMVYILLEISKRADQNPTYSGGILCLDCRRHDDARSRRAGQCSQSRSIQTGPFKGRKETGDLINRAIVPFGGTIAVAVLGPRCAPGATRSPPRARSRRSPSIRGKRSNRA